MIIILHSFLKSIQRFSNRTSNKGSFLFFTLTLNDRGYGHWRYPLHGMFHLLEHSLSSASAGLRPVLLCILFVTSHRPAPARGIIFTCVTSLPSKPVNSLLFYNKSKEINLDFQNSNFYANLRACVSGCFLILIGLSFPN